MAGIKTDSNSASFIVEIVREGFVGDALNVSLLRLALASVGVRVLDDAIISIINHRPSVGRGTYLRTIGVRVLDIIFFGSDLFEPSTTTTIPYTLSSRFVGSHFFRERYSSAT